jgi:hypothetical protein
LVYLFVFPSLLPQQAPHCFDNITEYLSLLSDSFQQVKNKTMAIEVAHDSVRHQLVALDPVEYPMGSAFTCITSLVNKMMASAALGTTYLNCMACGYRQTILQISECFQLKDTGPLQDGREATSRQMHRSAIPGDVVAA